MTYTLIAHTELTGSQASIVFSSIPATFTDLYLVTSLRDEVSGVADAMTIYFNASTSGYSVRRLYGNGSGSFSDTEAKRSATSPGSRIVVNSVAGATATANTFANNGIYIPNYRSAAAKSVSADGVTENNATTSDLGIIAGLWSGTDAITTITIEPYSSVNFVQFSSATLYGITAGSSGGVVVS
jgi:hypothetical protein